MNRVKPIRLSGDDAKRCARRVHNEWDPSVTLGPWETPDELQMRFDNGIVFEAGVFVEVKAALGASHVVDLSAIRGRSDAEAATLQAISENVPIILGGSLPDDETGGRTGRPDLLLSTGAGRYTPGDIKSHKMVATRARGTLTYSLPNAPADRLEATGLAAQSLPRFDDYFQLAHYWRMLEAMGRAPHGPALGFIIGTDSLPSLTPHGKVLTWLQLDIPQFETYSRSRGKARRSALQRYDHEHTFRLKIAAAAANLEPAVVQPIFTNECDSCPWLDHCRSVAGVGTASEHVTSGRLSVREWSALAKAGILSVEDLADLDSTAPSFTTSYLPEVAHLRDPLERLDTAIRRARMSRDGLTIERDTTGPTDVPRADIEIDFDIEWDFDNQVYIWGALVNTEGAEPRYNPTVTWDPLDDYDAVALAQQFTRWLQSQIAAAKAAGRTLLVYHYSSPEPTYLKQLLGPDEVEDLLTHFVDLLPIIRVHYFGLSGLGIKKVAPAFGFAWRDEDPGGLQSQLWLLAARGASEDAERSAARKRILDYNEDDVRATSAIRAAISNADTPASGPDATDRATGEVL